MRLLHVPYEKIIPNPFVWIPIFLVLAIRLLPLAWYWCVLIGIVAFFAWQLLTIAIVVALDKISGVPPRPLGMSMDEFRKEWRRRDKLNRLG